jgi:hypothetical protein
MQRYVVDGLVFDFDDGWLISKYDDWAYYRKHFCGILLGTKALDLLVISPDKTAYLVEVKDYRHYTRTKPSDISLEMTRKVVDTLAALLPAKVNATETNEMRFAERMLGVGKLRVILHLEQPRKHSKLFPRAIDPVDIQQKLRQMLKPIDAHPFVAETTRMGSLSWRVT